MVIGTSAIIDTEIDGAHAGRFSAELQNEISRLSCTPPAEKRSTGF